MMDEILDRSKKFEGGHKFLAEELLVPNLNKTDGNRINMFTNHVVQALVLDEMDFPRVFTNFENQIGKYSSSYKIADRDWKIIRRIDKNSMNYILVVQDDDNNIDLIQMSNSERVTQRYGFKYENKIKDKKLGDVIEKDELIYRSSAYDDNLNFKYGINAKSVYLSYKNLEYEDGIIVSESCAERMSNHSVDEIVISLNNNDVLLNLLGDEEGEYKCFPDIGEYLDGRILGARRRINYDSILYDLSTENLGKINFSNDTIFYVDENTQVVDVDVYYNSELNDLKKYPYYDQIIKYIENNERYYREIVDTLTPYILDPKYKCDDNVTFIYRRSKDFLRDDVKIRYGGNKFDNIVLKIKTVAKNPLHIGSKLSGRYGKIID